MADLLTPNLSGASDLFNKLASQFDTIKDQIVGGLEKLASELATDVKSEMDVVEADLANFVPELPSAPDVSFISEMTNLFSNSIGSPDFLSALSGITSQFGSGISDAGKSLDGIVSDVTSAFSSLPISGGIPDLSSLGDMIPNFVIGPDGIPALKPQDVKQPDEEPVDEDGADLITPIEEIKKANEPLEKHLSTAVEKIKAALSSVSGDASSESGLIPDVLKNQFAKADVIAEIESIAAGNPPSPRSAKIQAAVAAITNLPLTAASEEPVDEDGKNISGTSPLNVGDISAQLKSIQDTITSAKNNTAIVFGKTFSQGLDKASKPFPQNLISAQRKFVNNPEKTITWFPNNLNSHSIDGSRTANLSGVKDFYEARQDHVNRQLRLVNKNISAFLTSEVNPNRPVPKGITIDSIKLNANNIIDDLSQMNDELDDVFTKAKKNFSVESDEEI